jgi:hypothetical protein
MKRHVCHVMERLAGRLGGMLASAQQLCLDYCRAYGDMVLCIAVVPPVDTQQSRRARPSATQGQHTDIWQDDGSKTDAND